MEAKMFSPTAFDFLCLENNRMKYSVLAASEAYIKQALVSQQKHKCNTKMLVVLSQIQHKID